MNTTRKASIFSVLVGALCIVIGIYWFQQGERKVTADGPGASQPGGVTRDLAKGAMAAFLVSASRPSLAEAAFQDGAARPLTLADWKGKVVLVNLWATWCAPCRQEMPSLAALQSKLGSADFEVVAVSVDRKGAEASAAFLSETGAQSLKLYVDPTTAIVAKLQTIGLPSTFLIDRQGREIGRLIGPATWDSPEAETLIKAALAETP